jgi:hypothetical protein
VDGLDPEYGERASQIHNLPTDAPKVHTTVLKYTQDTLLLFKIGARCSCKSNLRDLKLLLLLIVRISLPFSEMHKILDSSQEVQSLFSQHSLPSTVIPALSFAGNKSIADNKHPISPRPE